MNAKVLNLTLMILWAAICIGLLSRELWMPPALLDKVSGPQTPLVIALTGLLTLWNLMRFWVSYRFAAPQRESATINEYRRRIRGITGEDPKVTDPEFRFDDPPPEDGRR